MSARAARTLTAKLLNSATANSDRTPKTITRAAVKTPPTSTEQDVNLKHYIKLTNAVDPSPSPSSQLLKPSKSKKPNSSLSKPLSELILDSIRNDIPASVSDSKKKLLKQISSIVHDDIELEESNDARYLPEVLEVAFLPTISHNITSLSRREVSRRRKQDWLFKSTQDGRFGRLVRMCTKKLGAKTTIKVFGKLDRATGVKEFNAMIEICIEKARNTNDEDVCLEEFHRAYMVFESMRERGFKIEEVTYGPFLMFIIDMGMVEEFHFFCDSIKKENAECLTRLAYYEMLLWIKVDNEDKIQTLIANTLAGDESDFNESYLVALGEADRHEEVSMLLKTLDIKQVSSKESVERIFKSLGRLSFESYAKKFILELKIEDKVGYDLSDLICGYTMSIPNIEIEDVVIKFKNLQDELTVASSSVAFEKLIKACCDSREVYLAIDLVESVLEGDLTVKICTINSILTACYVSCEYNLVHRINSLINNHNIHPNSETFRIMISLLVKLKDFDGAYGMIKDVERFKLLPNANMYNTIMGGYFRQKNFHKGLEVLKQMDASNVKPDSHTFSYIIGNCNTEDDIIKYRRELQESGVQPTKYIFMGLINAYAACGLYEKAKQVLLDKNIPVNNLNEIKSVLVSALATTGKITDALNLYDEMGQVRANLEPKAVLSLIEHLQSEGELSRLLQLLNQLHDLDFWDDGCARVILYCVRYKLLSSIVDLLKQRMEKAGTNEMFIDSLFDEVFFQIAEIEPTDVQFGLDLLQAIKEDIGIQPSRKSLDFLLSACVKAKDLEHSYVVWKEYPIANLPYNVLSYVRMYQALLASGDHKAAKMLLEDIADDDYHVCSVLKQCQETFGKTPSVECEGKKKKKKKKRNRK